MQGGLNTDSCTGVSHALVEHCSTTGMQPLSTVVSIISTRSHYFATTCCQCVSRCCAAHPAGRFDNTNTLWLLRRAHKEIKSATDDLQTKALQDIAMLKRKAGIKG